MSVQVLEDHRLVIEKFFISGLEFYSLVEVFQRPALISFLEALDSFLLYVSQFQCLILFVEAHLFLDPSLYTFHD